MFPSSRRFALIALTAAMASAPFAVATAQTFGLSSQQAVVPVASAKGVVLAPKISLEITKLQRLSEKGVLQLEFTVANRSDLATTLRDQGLASNFALENVRLVDFANKRRYSMGLSNGTCLCSSFGGVDGGIVKPGETKTFWAWFAMPASDVREMSVLLPDRTPILNVQLQ